MKIITPEISVIIPVYKAQSTLERAISSINNQLYDQDKIEIILSVDDNYKKAINGETQIECFNDWVCLLYTSPSPRDSMTSRMPSSA